MAAVVRVKWWLALTVLLVCFILFSSSPCNSTETRSDSRSDSDSDSSSDSSNCGGSSSDSREGGSDSDSSGRPCRRGRPRMCCYDLKSNQYDHCSQTWHYCCYYSLYMDAHTLHIHHSIYRVQVPIIHGIVIWELCAHRTVLSTIHCTCSLCGFCFAMPYRTQKPAQTKWTNKHTNTNHKNTTQPTYIKQLWNHVAVP